MEQNQPDRDDQKRREEATERVESMPGETALGNADPQGPTDETPAEWEAEHRDSSR